MIKIAVEVVANRLRYPDIQPCYDCRRVIGVGEDAFYMEIDRGSYTDRQVRCGECTDFGESWHASYGLTVNDVRVTLARADNDGGWWGAQAGRVFFSAPAQLSVRDVISAIREKLAVKDHVSYRRPG